MRSSSIWRSLILERARPEPKSMSDEFDPKTSGLLPVGRKALTIRSSALVRRGLEDLKSNQVRIVRFPANRSMGKLYISDKGLDPLLAQAMLVFAKDHLSDARGNVAIPFGKKLCLKVSDEA